MPIGAAQTVGSWRVQSVVALAKSHQKEKSARGLTPDDINAALKTYVPSGKWDDYYLFASGGHSGNLIVIGVPSMRILKNIAVFTPEAWQGYGIGDLGTEAVLDGGQRGRREDSHGRRHHPALSETNGDYDGQWVFINDKASARVAVIDLRDFRTKQIVKDPNVISNHGSTMVTPNTDYIIQGTPVRHAAGLGIRADQRIQGEVPRRDHPVEVRPRAGAHHS
jgi:nitrous-oxide reductase